MVRTSVSLKSEQMMSSLKRITTEYIELEDRVRLAGLTGDDQTVSIWLTMRLLKRLINHCLNLLDTNTPELKTAPTQSEQSRENMKNFLQQSAEQQIVEEKEVKVTDNSPNYLVVEIDVKNSNNGIVLIFKGKFRPDYAVHLNNQQLRQWLGMLHMIWQKAEWPNLVWPDWMSSSSAETVPRLTSIH